MDSTLHTISSSWKPGDLLIESVLDGEENILQVCEKIPYGVTLIYFGSEYPLKVMTPAEKKLMDLMPPPVTLDSSKFIISPMPGAVFSIKVKEGDVVGSGEEICVVEAMKMQNILRAPSGGKVKKILVKAGDTVSAEEILVEFE